MPRRHSSPVFIYTHLEVHVASVLERGSVLLVAPASFRADLMLFGPAHWFEAFGDVESRRGRQPGSYGPASTVSPLATSRGSTSSKVDRQKPACPAARAASPIPSRTSKRPVPRSSGGPTGRAQRQDGSVGPCLVLVVASALSRGAPDQSTLARWPALPSAPLPAAEPPGMASPSPVSRRAPTVLRQTLLARPVTRSDKASLVLAIPSSSRPRIRICRPSYAMITHRHDLCSRSPPRSARRLWSRNDTAASAVVAAGYNPEPPSFRGCPGRTYDVFSPHRARSSGQGDAPTDQPLVGNRQWPPFLSFHIRDHPALLRPRTQAYWKRRFKYGSSIEHPCAHSKRLRRPHARF